MKACIIGLLIILGLFAAMFAVAIYQVERDLYKQRKLRKRK